MNICQKPQFFVCSTLFYSLLLLSVCAEPVWAISIKHYTVRGEVSDVVSLSKPQIRNYAISKRSGRKRLVELGDPQKSILIPSQATFVSRCARASMDYERGQLQWQDTLLYLNPYSVQDVFSGQKVLKKAALFSHADLNHVFEMHFCNQNGEMLFPAKKGMHYTSEDMQQKYVLRFRHSSKEYSGLLAKSALFHSDYASAISLYAPKTHWVDIDEDGDLDLILELHQVLSLYIRDSKNILSYKKTLDLRKLLKLSAAEHIELLISKIDQIKGVDILVTSYKGRLPSTSLISYFSYNIRAQNWSEIPNKLLENHTFTVALGIQGDQLILRNIETGTIALGQALMSGKTSADITYYNLRTQQMKKGPELEISVDLRAGKVLSLPQIVSLDLNHDGQKDLLHFPNNHQLEIYTLDVKKGASKPYKTFSVAAIEAVKVDETLNQLILFHGYNAAKKSSQLSIVKP